MSSSNFSIDELISTISTDDLTGRLARPNLSAYDCMYVLHHHAQRADEAMALLIDDHSRYMKQQYGRITEVRQRIFQICMMPRPRESELLRVAGYEEEGARLWAELESELEKYDDQMMFVENQLRNIADEIASVCREL